MHPQQQRRKSLKVQSYTLNFNIDVPLQTLFLSSLTDDDNTIAYCKLIADTGISLSHE